MIAIQFRILIVLGIIVAIVSSSSIILNRNYDSMIFTNSDLFNTNNSNHINSTDDHLISVNFTDLIDSISIDSTSINNFTLTNSTIVTNSTVDSINNNKFNDRLLRTEDNTNLNVTVETNVTRDSWELIQTVLKNTTFTIPVPPFDETSKGACVNLLSDVKIIFGEHRSAFQDAVAKCSRKSLGSYRNTMRCISKLEFDGLVLSQECSSCWAKTAHCGVKHCAHQCLFNTCVTKCQKCSVRECSKVLNECAGTRWMPLPCGLDPHSPIPENFKVQDPK